MKNECIYLITILAVMPQKYINNCPKKLKLKKITVIPCTGMQCIKNQVTWK